VNGVNEITPAELKEKFDGGDDFQFIDVREEKEWNASHIEGARHMPMSRIDRDVGALDKEREVVLYCRTGARSGRVGQWMVAIGFKRVANLTGGIVRWEEEFPP
jgi:adenylyltransferase/sulfurtransferase